jgi:hypothetical protein
VISLQNGDYIIQPSDEKEAVELKDFLDLNDFSHCPMHEVNPEGSDFPLVVNVIQRIYFVFDKIVFPEDALSVDKFFKKINLVDGSAFNEIYNDDVLVYRGYTLNDRPYGLGTLYFDNGETYQRGVFDVKGIREGREHYYSGRLKFEGTWTINHGYGPNAPRCGNYYLENGELAFSGKFKVQPGGVGWPRIRYPVSYPNMEKHFPAIHYITWQDLHENDNIKEVKHE